MYMHLTIEKLMNGDTDVVKSFQRAREQWKTVFSDIETVSVADLALRLFEQQYWFESNLCGHAEGQEIMVWTAFASFWSDEKGYNGNQRHAQKVLAAFKSSHCSIEVKDEATDAAMSYYLDE